MIETLLTVTPDQAIMLGGVFFCITLGIGFAISLVAFCWVCFLGLVWE